MAEGYGTKYSISDLPQQLINKMQDPKCDEKSKKLGLPQPNKLIPKSFDILDANREFSKEPKLLKQWADCTDLWYKKDDRFKVPKTIV